jgi:hypothetical protein
MIRPLPRLLRDRFPCGLPIHRADHIRRRHPQSSAEPQGPVDIAGRREGVRIGPQQRQHDLMPIEAGAGVDPARHLPQGLPGADRTILLFRRRVRERNPDGQQHQGALPGRCPALTASHVLSARRHVFPRLSVLCRLIQRPVWSFRSVYRETWAAPRPYALPFDSLRDPVRFGEQNESIVDLGYPVRPTVRTADPTGKPRSVGSAVRTDDRADRAAARFMAKAQPGGKPIVIGR